MTLSLYHHLSSHTFLWGLVSDLVLETLDKVILAKPRY